MWWNDDATMGLVICWILLNMWVSVCTLSRDWIWPATVWFTCENLPVWSLQRSHSTSLRSRLDSSQRTNFLCHFSEGCKYSAARSRLSQGLMFYILYSWIGALHSWRMNMDILRPRRFLCCASKGRKWLLIGWRGRKKWWCDMRETDTIGGKCWCLSSEN